MREKTKKRARVSQKYRQDQTGSTNSQTEKPVARMEAEKKTVEEVGRNEVVGQRSVLEVLWACSEAEEATALAVAATKVKQSKQAKKMKTQKAKSSLQKETRKRERAETQRETEKARRKS